MPGEIAEVFSLSRWYDPNMLTEFNPESDGDDPQCEVEYALLKGYWPSFEGHFVITANPRGCLSVFTLERFDALEKQLDSTIFDDPHAMRYRKIIFGFATDLSWGPGLQNGIPRSIVDFVNLGPEALLLVFDSGHAEIWNEERLTQLAGEGSQSVE